MKRLPSNFKIVGAYSLLFFLTLTIYRFIFFIVYFDKLDGSTTAQVLKAFLIGVRFDLSVISMVIGPIWLLSSIHYLNRFKAFHYVWGLPAIPLFLWMIGHLIGDIIYFGDANKHLGYEGIVFLGRDLLIVIAAALKNDPIKVVLGLTGIFVGLPSLIFAYIKFSPYQYSKEARIREYVQIPISILVVFFLFRGGIQPRPLRPTDAIQSENNFLNNLPLNGVFTTTMDMKSKSIHPDLQMSFSDSLDIVRKEIAYPGAKFIDNEYPLLRETTETRTGTPPNIVLVILESWTGKFIRPNGPGLVDGIEVAPNFNRLLKQGHYFNRFFATGGRTTNGLMSILTGIPDRPGITAVRTHQVLGNFSGLGTILKQAGYHTLFVHGGDVSFDNMSFLFPHWGFDTIIGQEQIEKTGKYKAGAWGFFDADVLEELHEQISKAQNPFVAVALTLTTHYPYQVPADYKKVFDASTQEEDYFNTYHYADYGIGRFIEKAKKSKYFENTIFVFVADHTHHRNLDPYSDRNIPLLIYSPKYVKPAIDQRISSQLDLIPTILGLVKKRFKFSAMGRDLFSLPKDSNGGSYFAFSSVVGWVENDFLLYKYTDGELKATFPMPPSKEKNHCEVRLKDCEDHLRKTKSFLNLSYELMNRNRVFPFSVETISESGK
ncbi:alkaline phosphatase [Leptospira perolatii]|uniref:Alkaline phosphatase n=1 Tax=Leptospira perolatii TaxID=2023191 RepID=A0A2M9ZMM6_9LEPT|nr:LTA synthase family protein [Leptospira perolatii]PJZ70053.1 alkaline phosphatase [Leptospira perolatii]PJZ73241.1 alkaline phosphatase [Leptospira perolatii]